ERGLDYLEDLFNPVQLKFELKAEQEAIVIASLAIHSAGERDSLRDGELRRRASVAAASPVDDPLINSLVQASDAFVVKRETLKTVIAGYHWFADWGRDTMIALPGLCLVTGRFAVAQQILEAFAGLVSQGMLPNVFPDNGKTPEYNTVDATLWYFEAIRAYLAYTGDTGFALRVLYPVLCDIIGWHLSGTRFGIHVGGDSLLCAGEEGSQLTWMDARIGDWVVTPRRGKPVEIQALWYNALCTFAGIAALAKDREQEQTAREIAAKAKLSFNEQFWNASGGCLFDVVSDAGNDATMRPNQIFAVSLHHTMLTQDRLTQDRARQVVQSVQDELFTPLGLRSLSPHEPDYRPHYQGGVRERDSAYHQGAVWPWLMGPFLKAWCRVHDRSEQSLTQARQWLKPFQQHLSDACVGHISEIADAEWPHAPRGCVAQAWSTAELLRAAVEDIHGIVPSSKSDLSYGALTI
ncbi:MAG: glycogen debranching protein, partial [Bryobacteraceae bacterium]|nr:glycogen debranching protein [Bryobacteraceae bacterium]